MNPITRSPDHPITRSPDHPITRSPDHPITNAMVVAESGSPPAGM